MRAPGGTAVATGGVAVAVDRDRDALLVETYRAHCRDFVRLAAFLTGSRDEAEEIGQDAFAKVHGAWRRVRDTDRVDAYLRTTVVNLLRSRLRRRGVAAAHRPEPLPDAASAETRALEHVQRQAVLDALHQLPRRQREAVALRYYADLSEAQTAEATGCAVGSVKSPTSRGLAALRPLLEDGR